MKQLLFVLTSIIASITHAQTGSVKGTLTDKQMNNEPLPFANVIIKDSSKGTTSDFDGLYAIDDLSPWNLCCRIQFCWLSNHRENDLYSVLTKLYYI